MLPRVLFAISSAVVSLSMLPHEARAAPVDFVREVRPIFERHCYDCHGEAKRKSGLRLDVKAAALKGGDNHGPDIIPGKAKDSPLIHFLITKDEDELMPPKGGPLSAADIDTITRWIDEGALWPDGVDLVKVQDKTNHWSFKPIAVPAGEHSVDTFITAKLKEHGLTMAPEADRVAWIRRATFDLIGLPPTPAQVDAFVKDTSPDAHAKVINVLLESPRYGERWAQHWLDVVRYADTHGFEVNTERPNAWPYRDYVIDAFNADTPYDQFIREQIVGDATGKDAATGFLVTASVLLPGQIGKDEPSKRLARQDSLDEIVMNIGQTFLGLSVGCARCHDHKFDPISHHDYYAMQAFIAGVEYGDRDLHTPEAKGARQEATRKKTQLAAIDKRLADFIPLAKTGASRAPISPKENVDRFARVKTKRLRFTIEATNNLEPCIDELEVFNVTGNNIALATAGATITSSGDTVVADRHELRFLNDGVYGNSRSWMSNETGKGWLLVEFAEPHEIDRVKWGRDRTGRFKDRLATAYRIEIEQHEGQWGIIADDGDRQKPSIDDKKPVAFSTKGLSKEEAAEARKLMGERRPLEAAIKSAEEGGKAFAGKFRTPDEIHLLSRGDPEQPKELVTPAVPVALGTLKIPNETPEQERRQALAEWIVRPENPFTARVMVNRIWQGHFGIGLVETASDFGRSGMAPSHPELLDWLAQEFIRSGWSVKQMHKRIMLSAAYRQAARENATASAIDADVRLLWRFPTRRLEAEVIRDSMLDVAGKLNLKMRGRGFDLFDKRGGLSGFIPVESFTGDGLRRMIYAHKVRREREATFGAFDCPDAGQSTARRRESITPIQALNLFNSRFTLEQSEAFALRVKQEAGEDATAQMRHAWRLALGREPSPEELSDFTPLIREHGLPALCRAIFNSNEFLFAP
ncbi:cytochrome c [Roseimicrobium gellanilyticum]|uniref:Cytochrome c n=1 Tax=Roseimicrobium gellanilyticum TaxID=748857 RepID=A0A366H8J8_9BACT|nr:PSD1 and planctomycete cytochrome C domain-containing protein [Roseimicrobium gellanilyticum]RBP37364.1 cytochrome c [Roseimicrobium gellanilyticum]